MKLLSLFGKFLFIIGTIFMSGCEQKNICNMTPSTIPQNQSHRYTFSMGVHGSDGDILQKSIKPYIIINGEKHEMQKHPDGNNIFVYDYYFNGTGKIPFYFELIYDINRNNSIREKIAKSDLFYVNITNKYIFTLDSNRGPIGSRVTLVGCGLSRTDRVRFGSRIIPSNWLSTGAIEFTVPLLECGNEYDVHLLSDRRELFAGTFFVDTSILLCSTDFIRLWNGESQRVVFMLDHPAPQEGVFVDVTTDIPDSIIMPEVHFNSGENTVSVNVTGSDKSGKGTLFVTSKGFSSLEIPVEIGNVSDSYNDNISPRNYYGRPAELIHSEDVYDDDIVIR